MPSHIPPSHLQYHFILKDSFSLRHDMGIDPWEYPSDTHYVTILDYKDNRYENSNMQLFRKSGNMHDGEMADISIYQYDTGTPWETLRSHLLAHTYPESLPPSPRRGFGLESQLQGFLNDMAKITSTGLDAHGENMNWLQGNLYRNTVHRTPVLEKKLSPKTFGYKEPLHLSAEISENRLDPGRQVITFQAIQPPSMPLSCLTKADRAVWAEQETANHHLMMEFMDHMVTQRIIEPVTDLPSRRLARILGREPA